MIHNQTQTIVDLIRHGEPVGGPRYRGQLDDPLSEKGLRQMREAVADHHPWQAVVSSPLRRCAAFAEELAASHGLPLQLDERLMEIGFGAWEGRTAAELMAEDAEQILKFWRAPLEYTPPGAESLLAFRERVIAAWHDLLHEYNGQHVLLVGHAGMIRMIICEVLSMPVDKIFRLQVDNAAISRVRIYGTGEDALPQLLFLAGQLPN
ncbi:MAG: histidine phosphatase family protein [Thiohalomonadaceae bacterium]|jgi:alpha-ribazole phosphatase/probable phosphoglycerate mutase